MDAAVKLARDGYKRTGINLLKLEVLTPDHTESNDTDVVNATSILDDYRVMPLISANVGAAKTLIELGVPVLRVMGSPIGSGRGIDNPHAVREIVSLGVPVILDGGIGYVGHALEALRLGCAGLLVNSALFTGGDPASRLAQFRQAIKNWSPEMMAHWRGEPELEWVEWYASRKS
jgi:thiazole synthase